MTKTVQDLREHLCSCRTPLLLVRSSLRRKKNRTIFALLLLKKEKHQPKRIILSHYLCHLITHDRQKGDDKQQEHSGSEQIGYVGLITKARPKGG